MNNIALEIGPFTLHWYGILVAVGFILGLWLASRRGIQAGLDPEKVLDAGPYLILGAVIGARTLFVISYWEESFAGKPWQEIFMVHRGGLVFYGGLIGASIAFAAYALKRRLPTWTLADSLAPSVALGHAFGRMGCLMNGCCYGKPSDLPWAIRFPETHATHPQLLHPTQIYETLLNLALYAALVMLFRKRRFDGQVFAAYLMSYAVLRAFTGLFRGDYTQEHYLWGLTPGQYTSIGIFLAGGLLAYMRRGIPAPKPGP